jgi:hypothetical protein
MIFLSEWDSDLSVASSNIKNRGTLPINKIEEGALLPL